MDQHDIDQQFPTEAKLAPLCKDCKHYEYFTEFRQNEPHVCNSGRSMVTGELRAVNAINSRYNTDVLPMSDTPYDAIESCGHQAKFFEPK